MAAYNAGPGCMACICPSTLGVLYLSRIDDALWWEVLEDGETLYVQYNRVDPLTTTQLADLQRAVGDPAIVRICSTSATTMAANCPRSTR